MLYTFSALRPASTPLRSPSRKSMTALLLQPSVCFSGKQISGTPLLPARPHLHRRHPAPLASATGLGSQLAQQAFPAVAQPPVAPSASEATAWDVYTWLFLPSVKAGAYASATCLVLGLPLDACMVTTLVAAAFLIYGYDRGVKDAVRLGQGG